MRKSFSAAALICGLSLAAIPAMARSVDQMSRDGTLQSVRQDKIIGAQVVDSHGTRIGTVKSFDAQGSSGSQLVIDADGRDVMVPASQARLADPKLIQTSMNAEQLMGESGNTGAIPNNSAQPGSAGQRDMNTPESNANPAPAPMGTSPAGSSDATQSPTP